MDLNLRAPLQNDIKAVAAADDGNSSLNEGSTATWASISSTGSWCWYERTIYHHLCRMYAASRAMELWTESRFAGLALFHRYVRHFYPLLSQRHGQRKEKSSRGQRQQQQQQQHQPQSTEEMKQIKRHLGSVAAACLFLGCKMEEEPRRIRDVINLAHVLNFSSWEDDDDDELDTNPVTSSSTHEGRIIAAIDESPHPPPLDEGYWTAKERMVSTEQHVLRMIRFDTTVCHPHRCALSIMETLGFGTGKNNASCKSDDGRRDCDDEDGNNDLDNNRWLLTPRQSENVILRAWRILNEMPLDPRGLAMQYPVIVISCAAIALAASGDGIVGSDNEDGDDGMAVDLPNFWWRALDVSTKDISMAKAALPKGKV